MTHDLAVIFGFPDWWPYAWGVLYASFICLILFFTRG